MFFPAPFFRDALFPKENSKKLSSKKLSCIFNFNKYTAFFEMLYSQYWLITNYTAALTFFVMFYLFSKISFASFIIYFATQTGVNSR